MTSRTMRQDQPELMQYACYRLTVGVAAARSAHLMHGKLTS